MEPITTYELSKAIMPEFIKSFKKLEKAAVKLGVEAPSYEVVREFPKKIGERITMDGREPIFGHYVEVSVDGIAPTLSDWSFISKVDFSTGSSLGMFYTVPGLTVPEEFLSVPSTRCDHCDRKHHRKTCYLVRHESEGFKFVGSTCLKDFLGHSNPDSIAKFWSWYTSLEELSKGESGERPVEVWELHNILVRAATAIRLYGWKSSGNWDEYETSTRDKVTTGLAHGPNTAGVRDDDLRQEITDEWLALNVRTAEDLAEADATLEWMKSLERGVNDYTNNLVNLREIGFVNYRAMGIAVSAVKVALEKVREKSKREKVREATANSKHVGELKKRMDFDDATVLSIKSYMGTDYCSGMSVKKYIYTFLTVDGDVLIAFPTSELNVDEGDVVSFKATPKKHDEFNGVAQTTITRVIFKN